MKEYRICMPLTVEEVSVCVLSVNVCVRVSAINKSLCLHGKLTEM